MDYSSAPTSVEEFMKWDLMVAWSPCAINLCNEGYAEIIGGLVPDDPLSNGRAVYYSYLVVRAGSNIDNVEQMRGLRFAYNSEDSLSGYLVMVFYLQDKAKNPKTYFNWVHSGSHSKSIDLLLSGEVDGACVDYLVWRKILSKRPDILDKLMIIDKLGPNPIQPLILNIKKMTESERDIVREAYFRFCKEDELNGSLIKQYGFEKFISVTYEEDYSELDERIKIYKKGGSGKMI